MTTTLKVIVFIMLAAALFIEPETVRASTHLIGCDNYQSEMTNVIRASSAAYVSYKADDITFVGALAAIGEQRRKAELYKPCSNNISEHNEVMLIVNSMAGAVRTDALRHHPGIENAYVEKAYHAQYRLILTYGWSNL